jgi:hypothetical protein
MKQDASSTLCTLSEASRDLDQSEAATRKQADAGRLPFKVIGGARFFERSVVQRRMLAKALGNEDLVGRPLVEKFAARLATTTAAGLPALLQLVPIILHDAADSDRDLVAIAVYKVLAGSRAVRRAAGYPGKA